MQVSMKWLKDYVAVELSSKELAHKLTMAGIPVDAVKQLGEGITNVVAGEIIDVRPHPQADRLVICSVKISASGGPLAIVTGAKNVKAGMKVPVALVGATLPNGVQIEKAVFRGVESFGMLCSAQELQLDPSGLPEDEKHGIMSLPPEAEPGMPVQQILGLDDEVLELDLTPNRADCLSVINIAREVSAITGAELKLPQINEEGVSSETEQMAAVEIKAPDLCGRYIARVVKDIKIGPSPAWLRHRLEAAGMRSINNIVDVTNFVMLEMGQPLHAFDYDKLAGHQIIVRRAKDKETMFTLDGQKRQLDEEMLVIADAENPVAIAGVMGGLESEVTVNTKTILLESAHFDGASIRKTSRKLGLRSEASSRFEKGVNIDGALAAVNRAVDLIEQLGAGKAVPGKIDQYPMKRHETVIALRPHRVNQLLGTNIGAEEIVNILCRLHLGVTSSGDELLVKVPSYRGDLTQEVDLIEEVARIHGYDLVPTTLPQGAMGQSKKNISQLLEERAKQILLACGMTEIITYSFISPKALDKIGLEAAHPLRNVVKIKNPLSEEQSVMRTTLLPGLLEIASRNINRRQKNLSIFESGRVFWPKEAVAELPVEEKMLAGLVSGELSKTWNWPQVEMDFYYMKGILEQLLAGLNNQQVKFVPSSSYSTFHPGRTAEVFSDGRRIGVIGEIHPDVLTNYGLEQKACAFELQIALLIDNFAKVKQYTPLPKYPAVERDMALLVPHGVSSQEVEQVIAAVGGNYLNSYRLFDVYRGKQVPEGFKSMAYNLIYQAHDRTLTDDEVQAIHQKIEQELQDRFGAYLR